MADSPKLAHTLAFCALLAALGLLAGAWIGRSLLARDAGFDALAGMLGGMLFGGLVGFYVGAKLAHASSTSALRRLSWIALVLLVTGVVLGSWLAGEGASDPRAASPALAAPAAGE
jgi:hypothetical protein